jgi:polar amino acid transport system substrate-binding protein
MEETIMSKKILAIVMSIVLVCGVVCAFAACGKNAETNDGTTEAPAAASDLAYIKENGKMIIGITEYAPMNYYEGDKLVGFDTEFAEAVCEKLGVEAEFFIIADWGMKVNELDAKTIDCVWNGMTITDELKGAMSISDPYVVNAQVIVTKAENAEKYKTAEDLKGATVAVESGSAGEEVALAAGLTTIAKAAQSDALLEVKSGSADACVIDITMAKAMTGEGTSYEELVYTGSLSEEFYGIGFRKGSDTAVEVQKIIDELKADGTLDELAKKYNLTLAE